MCIRDRLRVVMDIVHSHAVNNEEEGLSRFDGTTDQYFYSGAKGHHPLWDSRCFDYGKHEVINFLLSNCKYWLEEFHFDGFRFDGITTVSYTHLLQHRRREATCRGKRQRQDRRGAVGGRNIHD